MEYAITLIPSGEAGDGGAVHDGVAVRWVRCGSAPDHCRRGPKDQTAQQFHPDHHVHDPAVGKPGLRPQADNRRAKQRYLVPGDAKATDTLSGNCTVRTNAKGLTRWRCLSIL
jgi:hypothetical protein